MLALELGTGDLDRDRVCLELGTCDLSLTWGLVLGKVMGLYLVGA